MHREEFEGKRILHSGRLIDVFNLRPKDIDIKEIAHALSLICRFGGHTPTHYSVAEHSVWVSRFSGNYALYGLLHDAAEAYLGDTCGTLKGLLCFKGHIDPYPGFLTLNELDDIIQTKILKRFGLSRDVPGSVNLADQRMLATEAWHFFRHNKKWRPWETTDAYPDIDLSHPLSAARAERAFLKQAWKLGILSAARAERAFLKQAWKLGIR